jgi:hypothetical protein
MPSWACRFQPAPAETRGSGCCVASACPGSALAPVSPVDAAARNRPGRRVRRCALQWASAVCRGRAVDRPLHPLGLDGDRGDANARTQPRSRAVRQTTVLPTWVSSRRERLHSPPQRARSGPAPASAKAAVDAQRGGQPPIISRVADALDMSHGPREAGVPTVRDADGGSERHRRSQALNARPAAPSPPRLAACPFGRSHSSQRPWSS